MQLLTDAVLDLLSNNLTSLEIKKKYKLISSIRLCVICYIDKKNYLSAFNFTHFSAQLLNFYVSDCCRHVRYKNRGPSKQILNIGVSQGSILGSLLFLIYFINIFKLVPNSVLYVITLFNDNINKNDLEEVPNHTM